ARSPFPVPPPARGRRRPAPAPSVLCDPQPPPPFLRAAGGPRPPPLFPHAAAGGEAPSIPRGCHRHALVADPLPAPAGSSIAAELHHHESHLKVYLKGGQVTFWKNNFGRQLLFVSNK
ncbi:unnamed protein product, partial [Urochloa humidicola]